PGHPPDREGAARDEPGGQRGHRVLPELRPLVPRLVDPARAHAGVARDALRVVQHAEPAPGHRARLRGPPAPARPGENRPRLPGRRQAGGLAAGAAGHAGDLPVQAGALSFPPTVAAALGRLDAADPAAYARTRNAIDGAVLRVSPWVTHGFVDVP